jgi:hypothetical protein
MSAGLAKGVHAHVDAGVGEHLCRFFIRPQQRHGRTRRVRAEARDVATHHILEPSYHGGSYLATRQYFVYHKCGEVFSARVSAAGFDVVLHEHAGNPAVVTFVTEEPATAIGR